jgi:hypothetical protein
MRSHNKPMQRPFRTPRPLPIDLRNFRAPRTRIERLRDFLEPHLYFWTPALVCCAIFAALLLTNYISWRV